MRPTDDDAAKEPEPAEEPDADDIIEETEEISPEPDTEEDAPDDQTISAEGEETREDESEDEHDPSSDEPPAPSINVIDEDQEEEEEKEEDVYILEKAPSSSRRFRKSGGTDVHIRPIDARRIAALKDAEESAGIPATPRAPMPPQMDTESQWGKGSDNAVKISAGWVALIALAICVAVLWAVAQLFQSREKHEAIVIKAEETLSKEREETTQAESLVDRIYDKLGAYFAAKDVPTLLTHVRHPERVKPLMERYYKDRQIGKGKLDRVRALRPVTLDRNTDFWIATVELDHGDDMNVLIDVKDPLNVKVDWETAVCDQPMDWEDYANEHPQGTTMDFRVYLSPDNLYSHEFSDQREWQCFRLTSKGSDLHVFGYVKRGSEVEAQIAEVVKENRTQSISLILRLSIPSGLKSPRGVVIDKLLSKCWLYIDPPTEK